MHVQLVRYAVYDKWQNQFYPASEFFEGGENLATILFEKISNSLLLKRLDSVSTVQSLWFDKHAVKSLMETVFIVEVVVVFQGSCSEHLSIYPFSELHTAFFNFHAV